MFQRKNRIHFVGIGGIGMSGIAEVLLNSGYQVSGSDIRSSATTRRLERLGARIHEGHFARQVQDADVVVISSAIRADNPEVLSARERRIPVIPRAEMLAELNRMKHGVLIAGAHGKTTTTSLAATVLADGGFDPTVVIGGILNTIDSNAKLGQGQLMVAEADESDGSFLHLNPTIAVVTNIDEEHLDHYGDMDQLCEAFLGFINKTPFFGMAFVCLDDPWIQSLIPRIDKPFQTYGLSPNAQIRALDIQRGAGEFRFRVRIGDEDLGEFRTRLPGIHNVLNSLATIGIAHELGMPADQIARSIANFGGVQRRFEIIGSVDGMTVVDDYGHHPTEIRAVLQAARECYPGRVIAVFQPHRYSRLQRLYEDFCTAFFDADEVVLADVYPAGEEPIAGCNAPRLADDLIAHGHRCVRHLGSFEEIATYSRQIAADGDVLLCLGAGNINQVCRMILEQP